MQCPDLLRPGFEAPRRAAFLFQSVARGLSFPGTDRISVPGGRFVPAGPFPRHDGVLETASRLRQPSPRTAKLHGHPMSVWPWCKCHLRNVGLANEYRGSCAKVTSRCGVNKCYLSESKRENPSKEYSRWPSVT